MLSTTKRRSAICSHVEFLGFRFVSSGPISWKFPIPTPDAPCFYKNYHSFISKASSSLFILKCENFSSFRVFRGNGKPNSSCHDVQTASEANCFSCFSANNKPTRELKLHWVIKIFHKNCERAGIHESSKNMTKWRKSLSWSSIHNVRIHPFWYTMLIQRPEAIEDDTYRSSLQPEYYRPWVRGIIHSVRTSV